MKYCKPKRLLNNTTCELISNSIKDSNDRIVHILYKEAPRNRALRLIASDKQTKI